MKIQVIISLKLKVLCVSKSEIKMAKPPTPSKWQLWPHGFLKMATLAL
jgi:hypothetical protein